MSFGPSNTTKSAENNLAGVSSAATNQLFPQLMNTGTNLFGQGQAPLTSGQSLVTSGTNFLNTILGGNRANTTALLQPNISDITSGNTNTLRSINTLMPRGGGRSAALFGQSFAPTAQISNLFNTARTGAATALPQIGLGQEQLGTSLFGLGNQAFGLGNSALGTAGGVSANLGGLGQQQQQISNSLFSGLGSGLMGILGMPFGSGGTNILGKIFGQ